MTSQVAFVTGAASGIGLALSHKLARQGARLTLADRDAAGLERAMEDLSPWEVDTCVLDVTDRDAVERAIGRCAQRHDRLDLVVNNAGIGLAAETRDTRPSDWQRMIDINLHGVVHGIDAAYPIMARQGHGHIVNVASLAGLIPLPGESAYVASKFAVVGLTHALRAEAAAFGVRASVVCPGVIDTPIFETSEVIGFDKDKALALWPRGASAESCAAAILRGVQRNRATIVVTPLAHVLWRLHRLSPSLFLRAARLYMQRMRAQAGVMHHG